MCSGTIDWCSFDWNAFAILFTGIVAVGAAFWVGRKQTQIQNRQLDIQAFALRSELFDRRYEIYEMVKNYLGEIVATAKPPDKQRFFELTRAVIEAEFLFDTDACGELEEIREKVIEFMALYSEMQHLYATERHYGDGNPGKETEFLVWFSDRSATLGKLFHELKLSQ